MRTTCMYAFMNTFMNERECAQYALHSPPSLVDGQGNQLNRCFRQLFL